MIDKRAWQPIFQIVFAMLLFTMVGCASLKGGLSETVLMDYDQTNNFREYEFQTSIPWQIGTSQSGIYGLGYNNKPSGFWATFIICNIRNENSKAQTFKYNVHNFYVEHGGKKHYYKPLEPYTYSSTPNGLAATPTANTLVNDQFRKETQLGPDTDTFQKGYYPDVNYRIAIYVTMDGLVDTSKELSLRYEGHPNIMNPRNQSPVVKNPTYKSDLFITCRPQK